MIFQKNHVEDVVLDKLSISDYMTTAAIFVVKEAEGPNLVPEIVYGRKDAATENEAGDPSTLPTADNYRSVLQAKGFDDEEIVALASIEGFGQYWDPKKREGSIYPKLDNFYYKKVLTDKNLALHAALKSSDLKSVVEKFAQDQKAYHAAFGKAFTKMINLGHGDD
jgi:catalase (peroxidase I)